MVIHQFIHLFSRYIPCTSLYHCCCEHWLYKDEWDKLGPRPPRAYSLESGWPIEMPRNHMQGWPIEMPWNPHARQICNFECSSKYSFKKWKETGKIDNNILLRLIRRYFLFLLLHYVLGICGIYSSYGMTQFGPGRFLVFNSYTQLVATIWDGAAPGNTVLGATLYTVFRDSFTF